MNRPDVDQGGVLVTDRKPINPFWQFRRVILFIPRIIFYLFIAPWNYMAITNPPGGRDNRGKNYRIGLAVYFKSAVVLRFWGAKNILIVITLLALALVASACRLVMLWQPKLNLQFTWKQMIKHILKHNLNDSNQSTYLTERRPYEDYET